MSDPATEPEIPDATSPGNPDQPVQPGSADSERTPAGSAGDADGSPPSGRGETDASAPSAPEPDWRDRRHERLYAQWRTQQAEIANLKAQLAHQQNPAAPQPAQPPVDIDALANQKAQQIAGQQRFNDACNDVALKGREVFPDFDARITSLARLVNQQDPNEAQQYTALLTAALDNGANDAARILHHLGGDLNEAQRILAMAPTKMAVEITKLAMRSPDSVSNAPRPITPVGGRQQQHTQIDPTDPDRADNLSTAEWMRRREAGLAARDRR